MNMFNPNLFTIEVDSATAKILRDTGKAEIVNRWKNKKFKNFIKANIIDSGTSSAAAEKLMNALTMANESTGRLAENTGSILKNINLANTRLANIDNGLAQAAQNIGSVLKLTETVKALSFVGIGLSAINIAVDVAGFVIIANKIDELGAQLDQIAAEIEKLKDISISDMRRDCDQLSMDYNTIVDMIRCRRKPERRELENYLKRAKAFLSKLNYLLCNGSVDAGILLSMIYTLLPAYTSVLCLFLRAYYSEEKSVSANYDNFLSIFQELNSPRSKKSIQDYYILGQNFSYRDVQDILTVQLYTLFNERLEIEDQMQLIEAFGNDENFIQFEKLLDEEIRKEVHENAADIASRCGAHKEECYRVLAAC